MYCSKPTEWVCFPTIGFLQALPHLCQHVRLGDAGDDSQQLLSALIGLLKDSDPGVRMSFSQSVRFLLMDPSLDDSPASEVSASDVYVCVCVYMRVWCVCVFVAVCGCCLFGCVFISMCLVC